ncbi:MAG: hypothetical protein QM569_14820 [Acidovorax sp.]|uniref:hypothetical protein n=1 Tax=Acidovorax sp. TaxID=1872122 RepID=UPI0039E44E51
MSTGENPERAKYLWDQQDALLDRCELSARYHGKRERFLGGVERLLQAVTAIAATSAFADIAGKTSDWGRWFALLAAVASILPLVLGLSERARLHGQLKAQFKSILADMYVVGVEWTEEQLSAFKGRVAKAESDEPASLAALVIHCQNEIAVTRHQKFYPLKWWEVALMHFYGFNGARIVARGPRESAPLSAQPRPPVAPS